MVVHWNSLKLDQTVHYLGGYLFVAFALLAVEYCAFSGKKTRMLFILIFAAIEVAVVALLL
jgi:hypothetical protein